MNGKGDFVISWTSYGQDEAIAQGEEIDNKGGIYAQLYKSGVPPTIASASTSALEYAENDTVAIDSGITVSDMDSPNLSSATISISSGFVSAQDTLAFTNQNGITGSYNSGTSNSTTFTRNINITAVNDVPVATATNSALAYTENVTVAIDSGITISDVDSDNLASATVSITSGFVSTQDTLAFTNQNGITGSYNSSTGVLTLTGSSTVANYQTALRSVTYSNSSDKPSLTPRTISFIVNDGTSNSTTFTRNINITAGLLIVLPLPAILILRQ